MNQENRGTIIRQGGILRVENALAEDVVMQTENTGFMVISYAAAEPDHTISIQTLRLNVNRHTAILNSFGQTVCLCEIRKGMWIDAVFSPMMTRSIPPQSSAFLIMIRRGNPASGTTVTTDKIAWIDFDNRFLYTGNRNDINSQIRFTISDTTVITDRSGKPFSLRFLRPGQMVRITHADFQTAGIPPQTNAYHIQLI